MNASAQKPQWNWMEQSAIFAAHHDQLVEHGGLDGVRDPNALESALARPENLAHYGNPDAADLAAAYAFGIARNHAFNDGNKRTAWLAARGFLSSNGYALFFDKLEAIRTMQTLAAGEVSENVFAQWLRERIRQL